MIKDFNVLLSLNEIANCYKNNSFPNAHCLLWDKETSAELPITQSSNSKTQSNIITSEFNFIGIESEE